MSLRAAARSCVISVSTYQRRKMRCCGGLSSVNKRAARAYASTSSSAAR